MHILSIEFPMISQTPAGIQIEKVENYKVKLMISWEMIKKYPSFFHCASITIQLFQELLV